MMPKRLPITIVCFHISAALVVLAGILLVILWTGSSLALATSHAVRAAPDVMPDVPSVLSLHGGMFVVIALVSLMLFVLCAVGIEYVIRGLHGRGYWAWIAGIVISGLMIVFGTQPPFVGLVLGGLSLWGLVDPDSVAAFRPKPSENDVQ